MTVTQESPAYHEATAPHAHDTLDIELMGFRPSECLVYVYLPGQTSAVLAGAFRITGTEGQPTGDFAYARSYTERRDAVPLDPVELGTVSIASARTARTGGMFGVLRDGCPDAWGRCVIDARLGLDGTGQRDIDYMLQSPDDRAGALGFSVGDLLIERPWAFCQLSSLDHIIDITERVAASTGGTDVGAGASGENRPSLQDLQQAQTGLGGARPKVTVEETGHLWVAKLPQADDRWSNPRVEHATMQLARDCGISTAETKIATVAGRDVILVRRFDRQAVEGGYARTRLLSGLTLLGADEDDRQRWSYLRMADEIERHTADPAEQLAELFRRMVFNALISNTDDHPRNHAFVGCGDRWKLSPAYDLTPTPAGGYSRRLAMICGLGGRDANRENLVSGCYNFELTKDAAETIVDRMTAAVLSGWHPAMRAAGVTKADVNTIRSAFVCDGFGATMRNS